MLINLIEKSKKNFNFKIKSKIICFVPIFILILTKIIHNSCFPRHLFGTNFISMYVIKKSKIQYQNSNYNCLPKLQKLTLRILELTPNCPKLGFCLFLKFGQAIVIRVLMLNF